MKREAVEYVVDSRAFARALQFLKHARASKKRLGAELTWRDAELALADRAAVCAEMYIRAKATEMERTLEAEKAA